MTAFSRVNGGVAFGAEVFHPDDANGLRTNAELQWVDEITRFQRVNVDVTDLGWAAESSFGPLCWHNYHRCYLAMSADTAGIGQLLLAAGGATTATVSMRPLANSLTVGSNAPVVFGGASDSAYVYQGVADGSEFKIYYSADWATWTLASTSTFLPRLLRPAPAVVGAYTVIPGYVGSNSSLLVASSSGATVTTKVCTPGTMTGQVGSVATNGTIAVGASTNDTVHGMQVTLAGASTGSYFGITAPGESSAMGRHVAYDARLSKWVILSGGSSGYTGNLYWGSRSTPDWAAGAWSKLVTGYASIGVHSFTITPDGVWLVAAFVAPSLTTVTSPVVFVSIDGGSNWSVHPIGPIASTGVPTNYPRFSSSNGPSIALAWRPSTTTIEVLTSGQINNGAAIASTTV